MATAPEIKERMDATDMKTREELEAEFNATITLWSDSEERINAQLCRENNVVADSLESAEMMLLCG